MIDPLENQLPAFNLVGPEGPISASIELTSKCNLKCVMCPLTQRTSSTSLGSVFVDDTVWERFLDGLEPSVRRVILTGFGEPMLHPQLMRFLKDLQDRQILHSLTTNGVSVRPDFLAGFRHMTHLDHVNISIDTVDPENYQQVRKGRIEKCFATIEKLASAASPQTDISISCVLMKSTLHSLIDAPRIIANLGVHNLVLQSLFDQSVDGIGEHLLDVSGARETIEQIESEAARYGVTLHFESSQRLQLELRSPRTARKQYFDDSRLHDQARACGVAWDATHIDAAGKVFPCCRAAAINAAEMGDLRHHSLADVWSAKPLEDFRNSLAGSSTIKDVCATCTAVPAGVPSRVEYQAKLKPSLRRSPNGAAVITVTNTGSLPWTSEKKPRIGVAMPRDRSSDLYDETWISPNRICHIEEGFVAPGQPAHFQLPQGLSSAGYKPEHFQLVIDGLQWLPDTGFSLS